MASSRLEVRDLIDLASIEGSEASNLLSTVYSWKYEHMIGRAKALAGAGSALTLTTILPVVQSTKDSSISASGLIVVWASSGVLIVIGVVMYFLARRVQVEFVAAQALLAELIEVRPFLRRLKTLAL